MITGKGCIRMISPRWHEKLHDHCYLTARIRIGMAAANQMNSATISPPSRIN
jgi:hypothetical protein